MKGKPTLAGTEAGVRRRPIVGDEETLLALGTGAVGFNRLLDPITTWRQPVGHDILHLSKTNTCRPKLNAL